MCRKQNIAYPIKPINMNQVIKLSTRFSKEDYTESEFVQLIHFLLQNEDPNNAYWLNKNNEVVRAYTMLFGEQLQPEQYINSIYNAFENDTITGFAIIY